MAGLWMALAPAAAGCSCEGEIESGLPCVGPVQVEPCGRACADDDVCGAELFCGPEGVCTSECSPGVAPCPVNYQCEDHGRCGPVPWDSAALVDAPTCGRVNVELTAEVPIVMFVIDASSSMDLKFPGARSRFSAVQHALVNEVEGLIPRLDGVIDFGATLYTSHDGDAGGICPILLDVPPAANNGDAIAELMSSNGPDDDTPTGEAVDGVVAAMLARGNPRGVPQYLVLATDGEPDRCADPDAQDGQEVSIAAVVNAFDHGIRVFVLGVSSDVGAGHLQDLANAGAGLAVGGAEQERYFTADDAAGLDEAFGIIVGELRSCELEIDGTVDLGAADQGEVSMVVDANARSLVYGDDDGWRLVDGDTLELLGAACEDWRYTADVELTATFPCGSVVF